MQLTKLAVAALLSGYVAAIDDIDNDDIPRECRDVCEAVVSLSRRCDRLFDDDDRGELNCVCTAENAASQIPLCEACVAEYDSDNDDDDDDDDRDDNDVYDIVTSCGFARATFVAGGTTAPAQTIPGTAAETNGSTTVTQTTTGTQGSQTVITTTTTPTTPTDGGSEVTVTETDDAQITNTDSAAPGLSVEMGLLGSLFLGALGVIGLA
jgi:hypothetical protein